MIKILLTLVFCNLTQADKNSETQISNKLKQIKSEFFNLKIESQSSNKEILKYLSNLENLHKIVAKNDSKTSSTYISNVSSQVAEAIAELTPLQNLTQNKLDKEICETAELENTSINEDQKDIFEKFEAIIVFKCKQYL